MGEIRFILSRVSNPNGVLVWRKDLEGWRPANSIPELQQDSKPPPLPLRPPAIAPYSSISSPDASRHGVEPVDAVPRPWRRFFARYFDLSVFVLVTSVGLGLLFPELFNGGHSGNASDKGFDYLYSILILAIYSVVEAVWLNAFGGTLGKRLYGISITRPTYTQIGFKSALQRSMAVYVRGLAFGIPLFSLFTLASAYRSLGRNGKTSWDQDFGFSIFHKRVSAFRWFGIAVAWLFLISVWVGLIYLGTK